MNEFRLIQICVDPGNEKTKQRKISAIVDACHELRIKNDLIITDNEKDYTRT